MLSFFSSDVRSASSMARRFAWYGLFLVGMMAALWVVTQTAAMPSVKSPPEPPAPDSDAAAASKTEESAAGIEIFTWGNAAAVLLLVGGGGVALYLRQQQEEASSTTPFRRLGRLSLGPSKRLELVACGGEVLLLCTTTEEVTLLKTYDEDAFEEEEEIDLGAEGHSAAEVPTPSHNQWSGSFADVLNRFADRPPHA
jgi:flagellar protein FliO/FliZ